MVKLADPLSGQLVAVRKFVGPAELRKIAFFEVLDGHMALISLPAGSCMLLGPGTYKPSPLAPVVLDICWLRAGPVEGPGGKPMVLAISITEGTTADGFKLGLLCELKVRIWDPGVFCEFVLPRGGFLDFHELERLVLERARPALLEAISSCEFRAVEDPWFKAYLEHYMNVALSAVGLRVASLRLRSIAHLGGVRSLEELMDVLKARLPLPLDERRAEELEEKLELIRKRPWLLAKPSDPKWAREWRDFWAGLASDWMWAKGRFLMGLDELASEEPFSLLAPPLRREILRALRNRLGSHEPSGKAISKDVLDRLCSSLAKWALENGLYELSTADLTWLLGIEEREAGLILSRMIEMRLCRRSEREGWVVVAPET